MTSPSGKCPECLAEDALVCEPTTNDDIWLTDYLWRCVNCRAVFKATDLLEIARKEREENSPAKNLEKLLQDLNLALNNYCSTERQQDLRLVSKLRDITLCVKGKLRDIKDKEKNLSFSFKEGGSAK